MQLQYWWWAQVPGTGDEVARSIQALGVTIA